MADDIKFVETDAEKITNQLITDFENAYGETLYPGDERRIFLQQMAQVIVGLKNDINDTSRQNLLRHARGPMLDALGVFYDTSRLEAQKAKVTLKWVLSSAQPVDVVIPKGTRATPDGKVFFANDADLTIPSGQTEGQVVAVATEAGEQYNGFAPGQINKIVDPIPYVASVTNIDTSSGGSDVEDDDSYRERIRLAPERLSTAGPEGAYIYWAKTADVNIADVAVTSPSPCVVRLIVLMKDGQLPTQAVLDAVLAMVSAKDRRPMTDLVEAAAPTVVQYNLEITYYISSERQTEEAAIRDKIEGTGGSVEQYNTWQSEKLGRAINPDYLRQLTLNAGACRIDITSPVYTAVNEDQVAKVNLVNVTYGGLI